MAKDRAGGNCLGVDLDRVVGEPQHAHVSLEVALAVQQGGVLTLAGRQRLDVVGELALEVLGRLGSLDAEDAALGAVDHPGVLAQHPVLGVQLNRCLRANFHRPFDSDSRVVAAG